MTKPTCLFGALLLLPLSLAHACPDSGAARCDAHVMLADARDNGEYRYLESEDGGERGPLSVHVTTFDGSPATPGMWYERPGPQRDDDGRTGQRELPAAPFDRQPFDREER